jgi:hypothetical protein
LAGKTVADKTTAADANRRADETARSTANSSAQKAAYDGTADGPGHAAELGIARANFRIGVRTLATRHQQGYGENRNDFSLEHLQSLSLCSVSRKPQAHCTANAGRKPKVSSSFTPLSEKEHRNCQFSRDGQRSGAFCGDFLINDCFSIVQQ